MESWVDPETVWTLSIRGKSLVPARYRTTNQDFSVVHPIAKSHNKLGKQKYGGWEFCSMVGSWTNLLHHQESTSTDTAPYLQWDLTNGWRITNLVSSVVILIYNEGPLLLQSREIEFSLQEPNPIARIRVSLCKLIWIINTDIWESFLDTAVCSNYNVTSMRWGQRKEGRLQQGRKRGKIMHTAPWDPIGIAQCVLLQYYLLISL